MKIYIVLKNIILTNTLEYTIINFIIKGEVTMSHIIIPKDYKPHLNLIETEVAIKMIKDTFERRLAEQLRLTRVSAPLFLLKNTGLNDDLNGIFCI